jgi:hypothetical protein
MAEKCRRNFLGTLATCTAGFLVLLTGLCALLWLGSTFRSIGIFGLGPDHSLRFRAGSAHVEGYYAYNIAPGIPEAQWHTTAMRRGWTTTTRPPWSIPMFHYSTGHVAGIGIMTTPGSNMIYPANYWTLDVPLWALMIPGMIVGPWLAARWQRSDPTRQPRGFEIEPASSI